MPCKIEFLCDVGRFCDGKWRQVGSKIEWKIDVNCGRRVFEKRGFSLGKNDDFEGSGGSKINGKFIKNRLEIEAEDGVALGSDFS